MVFFMPDMKIPFHRAIDHYFAVVILLCFCLLVTASSERQSASYDEGVYFDFGLLLLEKGRLFEEAPCSLPISVLNAIPKVLLYPNLPLGKDMITKSKYFPILHTCRIPTLLLALLLALFVYRWSKRIYGSRGALLSLFFLCLSPDVIAYSRWINTDIPATTFCFISSYYFWRFSKDANLVRALILGATLGLALLTKFTALMLIPVWIMLTALLDMNTSGAPGTRILRPKRLLLALLAVVIGLAVLNAAYRFEGTFTLLKNYGTYLHKGYKPIGILGNTPIPLPSFYTRHLLGYRFGIEVGYDTYFMGKWSQTNCWYFLPVAFLIKTPIPAIILIAIALAFPNKFQRPPLKDDIMLLAFPIALFAYFFNRPTIFLRYILPMYPFIFVYIGRLAYPTFTRLRSVYYAAIGVGMCWYLAGCIQIYPHYLAYFNELIGGPKNGYLYLVDCHLDWGQNFILLEEYKRNTNLPIKTRPPFTREDIIAIRATTLMKDEFKWLRERYRPIDCIAYAVFIYDLSKPIEKPPLSANEIILYSGAKDTME
jgi:hypothetical protein